MPSRASSVLTAVSTPSAEHSSRTSISMLIRRSTGSTSLSVRVRFRLLHSLELNGSPDWPSSVTDDTFCRPATQSSDVSLLRERSDSTQTDDEPDEEERRCSPSLEQDQLQSQNAGQPDSPRAPSAPPASSASPSPVSPYPYPYSTPFQQPPTPINHGIVHFPVPHTYPSAPRGRPLPHLPTLRIPTLPPRPISGQLPYSLISPYPAQMCCREDAPPAYSPPRPVSPHDATSPTSSTPPMSPALATSESCFSTPGGSDTGTNSAPSDLSSAPSRTTSSSFPSRQSDEGSRRRADLRESSVYHFPLPRLPPKLPLIPPASSSGSPLFELPSSSPAPSTSLYSATTAELEAAHSTMQRAQYISSVSTATSPASSVSFRRPGKARRWLRDAGRQLLRRKSPQSVSSPTSIA